MQKIKSVICFVLLLLLILPVPSADAMDIVAFGSTASLHMNGGTGYNFSLVFSTSAGNQTIVIPGNGTVSAIYPNGNTLAIGDQLLYVLVTDTTGAPIGTILPNAIGSRSSTAVLQADGSMGSNGQMVGNTGTINFWFNGFTNTNQPGASYIVANKVWLNADSSPFTGTPPNLNFSLSGTSSVGATTNIPMIPGVPVLVQDGNYTVTEPNISGFTLISIDSGTMQTNLPARNASINPTSNNNYSVTFTNQSSPNSTSLIIVGQKTGTNVPNPGNAFAPGMFYFELLDSDGNLVETTTNTADSYDSTTLTATGSFAFPPIIYTAADVGVHTYTVQEQLPPPAGWTLIGTPSFTVTVTVSLSGNNIVATPTYPPAPGNGFTNNYTPSAASFTPEATKQVAGATTLAAGQFSFEIEENGVVVSTGTNDSAGNIIFKPIIYTAAGSHTYTVTETTPGRNGWSQIPPNQSYTFTVSVDGSLIATPTYPPDPGIVFTNLYTSGGTLTLSSHKVTTGGTMIAGQFQFKVTDEFGNQVATGTNDANGNIVFSTIRYTNYTPGSLGFHMYTITETTPSGGGWTTSNVSYPVLVRVADNGNGTMTVTSFNLNTDNFVFVNTYGASGSLVLNGVKRVTGGTLTDGQFQFAIVNESGVTVATGTNDATGVITFTPINYTNNDVGVHHYTVFETSMGVGGWTPSSVVYHVTVTVIDNGDGTITATPVYPREGLIFMNMRNALGSIALYASKAVIGDTITADEFSFAVIDDDTGTIVATGTNDANGNILFSAIPYTLSDVGPHSYSVIETTPAAPYWQTDSTVFDVSVNVVDSGLSRLGIFPSYPANGNAFTNVFAPPDRMLYITKTINGFYGFNVFDPNAISPISFLIVGIDGVGNEVYRGLLAFNSTNFQWNPNFRNYTAILHNLPAGTYHVYERGGNAPGYSVNHPYPPQIATVTDNVPGSVEFTNIYTRDAAHPRHHPAVTVNKAFHGIRDSEIPTDFCLILTGPNGFNETISLSDARSSKGGLFTNLVPGTYTVYEQNSYIPGFNIHVSVNGKEVTLPYSFEVTNTTGHIMITIDNYYLLPSQPSPATGDYREFLIPILMLVLGATGIIGAEIYRRHTKNKQTH